MTAPYYALFTDIGVAKLANATATDTPLNITAMGVGDANGVMPTPEPSQTSLINECRRASLNSLSVDPNNANQIVAEQVLPDDVGGWWIRELGLYDGDGDLIAVGNCPPSYKPLLEEGAGREQVIRIILIVSSDDAVTLKIDPSVVLATREYVDDSIEAHAKSRNHPDGTTTEKGFVQLSSATDSDDETKAATPKAVKAVKEVADAALPEKGTAVAAIKLETARKIAGHDFDGTADITIGAGDVGALPSGGTAAAATKLATARKIAGHDFDGTTDITIGAGDVGALPSGGTAAAATKLATARKIAGHDFDGTADITLGAGDVGALPSGGTAAAATKLATAHKIAGHAFDGTADIAIVAGDVGAYTKAESDSRYQSNSQVSMVKNGWCKTADGHIEQWGFISRTANTTRITFPIAFPNECFNVQLTLDWNGSFHDQNVYVQTPDKTGFNYIAGSGEVRSYFKATGH